MAKSKKAKRAVPIASPCKPALSPFLITQVALLCIITFLSPYVAASIFPVPLLAIQALIFFTALVWIMRAMKECALDLPAGLVIPGMAVFAALALLSAVDSISLHTTLRELANVMGYFLVFLVVASLRGYPKAVYLVLASLLLSGLIVGALGFKEYWFAAGHSWRVFATFFNPDYLAGFMAILLPVVAAWFLSRTSLGMSALLVITGLFVLGGLLLTGSRFGALCAFLGILVTLVSAFRSGSMQRPQRIRLAILLIPALLAVGVMAKPLMMRLSASHGVKAESHSINFRLYTWQGTARMAAAYPVNGSGLGTFELGYPQHATVGYTRLAHNSYLQIAAEAGPLASVVFLVLLGTVLIPCAGALWRKESPRDDVRDLKTEFAWEPEQRLLACGLLGGAAASIARNAVDSDWYITAVGVSFWVVMGAAVALAYPGKLKTIAFPVQRYAPVASILALSLVGVLMMLSGAMKVSSAQALMMEGDARTAISGYETAIEANPLDPEPHRSLGQLYLGAAKQTGDKQFTDKAKTEFLRVVALQPTSPKGYYQLSKAYEQNGRIDDAIEVMERGTKYDPNAPTLLLRLASLYELAGKQEKALVVYRKMTEVEATVYEEVRAMPEFVEPAYIFAHMTLGRDAESRGEKQTAIAEYEKAAERAGRYKASMDMMRAIAEQSPNYDPEMESRVNAVQTTIIDRLTALRK